MPTLLNKYGFKFLFYANEHEPKHVHVMKGGDYAKVDLTSLRVTNNFLSPSDTKKAVEIIREHHLEFERKWNEFFNR